MLCSWGGMFCELQHKANKYSSSVIIQTCSYWTLKFTLRWNGRLQVYSHFSFKSFLFRLSNDQFRCTSEIVLLICWGERPIFFSHGCCELITPHGYASMTQNLYRWLNLCHIRYHPPLWGCIWISHKKVEVNDACIIVRTCIIIQ